MGRLKDYIFLFFCSKLKSTVPSFDNGRKTELLRFLMVESLLVRTCACISSITSKSQAKSSFFQVRPPQRQHHDVVRPPERPRGRPGGGGDRTHAQGQAHLQLKQGISCFTERSNHAFTFNGSV